MSNVLQFPDPEQERPKAQPLDVAALIREVEGDRPPIEDQLTEMLESLNALDFEEPCKQRIDLDYEARTRFPDDTDEPPFWAEQYREACSEIEEAYNLICRAKTRLAFTLWHAFPRQKPINRDWMDAHVGKAHKAIQFQTFWTREGDFFVSACKLYDGRWIEYSDADMALIGFVLKDNGFQRYDCDGENGPQWFIKGEISDALKDKITKELEKFDFLAITWDYCPR